MVFMDESLAERLKNGVDDAAGVKGHVQYVTLPRR
jgi:hypothetical protein